MESTVTLLRTCQQCRVLQLPVGQVPLPHPGAEATVAPQPRTAHANVAAQIATCVDMAGGDSLFPPGDLYAELWGHHEAPADALHASACDPMDLGCSQQGNWFSHTEICAFLLALKRSFSVVAVEFLVTAAADEDDFTDRQEELHKHAGADIVLQFALLEGAHWILLWATPQERCIYFADSLHNSCALACEALAVHMHLACRDSPASAWDVSPVSMPVPSKMSWEIGIQTLVDGDCGPRVALMSMLVLDAAYGARMGYSALKDSPGLIRVLSDAWGASDSRHIRRYILAAGLLGSIEALAAPFTMN